MLRLQVFLIVTVYFHLGQPTFPPCKKYGDTFGKWYNVTPYNIENFFHDGDHGGVLEFFNIWLPDNCSYRRFNNNTIDQSVYHILKDRIRVNPSPKLEIYFVGDSLLRGIFCGIGRIIVGNEIDGPNINKVCGGGHHGKFLSPNNYGQFHSVDFGEYLRLTFVYVKTFHFKHMDYIMEHAINMKPYVVIVNTGIWDFDCFARPHLSDKLWNKGPEECATNESTAISNLRADGFVNYTIWEMNRFANDSGVRLIYRNNHHNQRFGVICADEQFEGLLNGTNWEIWDNKRISEDVWKTQNWDGLHFDRSGTHTIEEHKDMIKLHRNNGTEIPGQLEMQLSQSLLNTIFYDTLAYI
jgi:hypothetical protein